MLPRTHLTLVLIIPIACAIFGAAIYSRLPDPCPTHWNFRGEADKFGPPWQLAYGLPLVELGLAILLIALPWLGPFRANFDRFRVIYGRIAVTVMTGIAAINVVFTLKAAGHPIHIGAAFSIIFGLLLAVLGNWMGKIRRNLYVGIRTPWTIANDLVWERTHRIGGKFIVVGGLLTAIVGLFAPSDKTCFIVAMSWLAALVAWAMIYSCWLYHRVGSVDQLNPANGGN